MAAALLIPQGWLARQAVAAPAQPTVVLQQSFEDGQTGGWTKLPWGSAGDSVVSTVYASEGTHSLEFTNRAAGSSISLDLTGILQSDHTYDISLKARLGQGTDTFHLASKITAGGKDNYPWLIPNQAVNDTGWTTFEGSYEMPSQTTSALVYFEPDSASASTADVFIDEVVITDVTPSAPPANAIVLSQSFEDDQLGGWEKKPWGADGTAEISSDVASDGAKSLKFTNRASSDSQPSLNLTGILQSDHAYDISLKVRLGEGSGTYHIASNIDSPVLDNKYPWIAGDQTVTSDGWTTFAASGYEIPSSTSAVRIWLEPNGTTSTADIYIDEVVIKDVTPGGGETAPVDTTGVKSDFEDGIQGWVGRNADDIVSLSTADNHTPGGTQSLLTEANGQYHGPLLNVLGKMSKNYQYELSAWVKMAPGQPATALRISVQHGDSTFTNVSSNVTVTDGAWVQLKGNFTLPNTPAVLNAYVELANNDGKRIFYMDDFQLTYIGPVDGPLPIQTDIPSMKDVYADDFTIGAAVTPEELADGDLHADLLKKHFNSLVAENAMKWESIEPQEGQFNFTGGDAIRDFAKANGMQMRGHTLVWHSQTPDWVFERADGQPLTNSPEDQQILLNRLENHIKTIVEHYGTDVQTYDVVNEVIDPSQPDGFRHSKWYEILGPQYIDKAFEFARKYAPPGTTLVINDYGQETDTKKRQLLYNLVKDLKSRGVPVDAVGDQMHINITRPTADEIKQTFQLFASLGVKNQVTELDMSVYSGAGNYASLPEDVAIEQGHRYAEIFSAFKEMKDTLTGVTFWGIADDHTWLNGLNGHTNDYPLPFDSKLQAKQAFWGIVDPSKLQVLTQHVSVGRGTPVIDGSPDLAWSTVSPLSIGTSGSTPSASVKTMWDDQHLYVYADVTDPTSNAADAVDVYIDRNNGKTDTYEADDAHYTLTRDQAAANGADYRVQPRDGGYIVEAAFPLADAVVGQQIGFDLTVTDADSQKTVPWNDTTLSQNANTSKYGVLQLIEASKTSEAIKGMPVIDGQEDAAWENAHEISTDVWVQGTSGATAKVKTMWDDGHLYVLAHVTDSLLSKASANAYEQDSVEIFVDPNNGKTTSYELNDGQYRVNFDNEQSYNGAASASNFHTATTKTADGYIVEAAIDLDSSYTKDNSLLGFDVQVNNDEDGDGTRDSVAIWNDPTGNSYQDTSRWGVLKLAGSDNGGDNGSGGDNGNGNGGDNGSGGGNGGGNGSGGNNGSGNGGSVVTAPGLPTIDKNTIKPVLKTIDGRTTATVSANDLQQALAQAPTSADGKKQVVIGIPAQTGSSSYGVQLPVQSLKDAKTSVLTIQTEFGTVTLPGDMLSGSDLGSSDSVTIVVSKHSAEGLSDEVRGAVGNRPVIDLALMAGDKTISWSNRNAPVTVSVPYTPTAEELKHPDHILVWYVDGSGKATPVPNARYDAASGTVRFQTTHFSVYAVTYVAKSFDDLQSVPWAKDAIEAMASRGIINGTTATTFDPSAAIKRADFIALLVRALELKGTDDETAMFSDVQPTDYYYEEVRIAKQLDIAKGGGDNTFAPNGSITRQDMMALTALALKAAGKTLPSGASLDGFTDAAAVADYAKDSAAALVAAGIIQGSGGKLDPKAHLTRAQAAVVLQAVWKR